mmetsp:Transcript_7950/g.17664  ORF Transcript_7950/g.17664 Transcript_7950/m.17664 type:complete len:597 (+) Transcript_7950:71-1861(+)
METFRQRLWCCTRVVTADAEAQEEPPQKKRPDLDAMWSVKLSDGGSVYDFALLNLAVRRKDRDIYGCTAFIAVTFVLFALTVLQYTVMDKVYGITTQTEADFANKVLGSKNFDTDEPIVSACHRMDTDPSPFHYALDGSPPEESIQCGLMAVDLLSDLSIVDLNNDTVWSEDEAEELQARWEGQWHQTAPVALVYEHVRNTAEEDLGTTFPAGLPMQQVLTYQWKLHLCAGWLPNLCGNYEARGILEGLLAEDEGQDLTPSERISACRDVISNTCPQIFGPVYRWHSAVRGEICGFPHRYWDSQRRILTTKFELFQSYVTGVAANDAVASDFFAVFLWLMIVTWTLVMLVEFRSLLDWWVVIGTKQLTHYEDEQRTQKVKSFTRDADNQLHINAISLGLKVYTVICHLIPRTILAFGLFHVGVKFLYITNDYASLLLNGIALGFLLDIDEMLYAAVVGPTDKRICADLADQRIYSSGWRFVECFRRINRVRHYVPVEIIATMGVVILSGSFMRQAFDGTHGKAAIAETITCLCQNEGPQCVGAQVLGANVSMSAANGGDDSPASSTSHNIIVKSLIHSAIEITRLPTGIFHVVSGR